MVRKTRNIMIGLLGTLIILSAVVGTYAYWHIFSVSDKFSDLQWLETASEDEIRRLSHRTLGGRIGLHHDACLYLTYIGTKESVPLLIKALKNFDDSDDFVPCSFTHCLEALKNLTGKDYKTYDEWRDWWDKVGRELAESDFYPREKSENVKRAVDVEQAREKKN